MRIAVFGGSFDPVHLEHVRVAENALRSLALDKLVVMPAACPPHKPGKVLTADKDRLETCRLAFAHLKRVEVSDYEIGRGGTSYTYLTCRHFKEAYRGAEIFWLVGTDMLRDFPTWRNTEDILENVTLAVCARAEEKGWLETERRAFYERFQREFALVDYEGKDVSSTKIRVLAGAGEEISAFVSESVAEYIRQNRSYEIPNAKAALALETPARKAHSLRVAETAAKKAVELRIPEKKAIAAALFHDCAKNLAADSPLLKGFSLDERFGEPPPPVLHQFTGAYLAESAFGVNDAEVLDAIRFHTSGRAGMTELEKLIFLADMVEEGRSFEGVDELRTLFWQKKGAGALDECLLAALKRSVAHITQKGEGIYPLTLEAYEFYKRTGGCYGKERNDE